MPLVDTGETHSWRLKVVDATGALGNAGASPTVLVVRPDGTTVAATVTPAGTGLYDVDFATTLPGRYAWTATATGGVLGSAVRTWGGAFDADDPTGLLVDPQDALAHLRASGLTLGSSDLEQLRWLCAVATDAVERDLGHVLARRTITAVLDGHRQHALDLPKIPPPAHEGGFVTVTSVVEDGVTLTAGTWTVRRRDWTLLRGTPLLQLPWAWGTENVTVVYQAGCTAPPPIARKVALNGIERMWQSSQQTPHPALDDPAALGDGAIFSAAGTLTPLEMAAYRSLRADPVIA